MFACERGKGSLTSPNAAAATPRWAEDAPSLTSSASTSTTKRKVGGGEFDNLRSDVARRPPLEVLYASFNPLTKALSEATTPLWKRDHPNRGKVNIENPKENPAEEENQHHTVGDPTSETIGLDKEADGGVEKGGGGD